MAAIKYTILTLPDTHDRLSKTKLSLEAAGVTPNVFYGINNNKLALRRFGLSNGLIGCYISHLCMWQQQLGSNADWFVFIEDDYIAPQSFMTDVELHLTQAPLHYDAVVLLSYDLYGQAETTKVVNELFLEKKGVWSTALFAIRNSSLQKMCNVMGAAVEGHIDIELWSKHESGKINICYAKNNIGNLHDGSQKSSVSTKRTMLLNGLSQRIKHTKTHSI